MASTGGFAAGMPAQGGPAPIQAHIERLRVDPESARAAKDLQEHAREAFVLTPLPDEAPSVGRSLEAPRRVKKVLEGLGRRVSQALEQVASVIEQTDVGPDGNPIEVPAISSRVHRLREQRIRSSGRKTSSRGEPSGRCELQLQSRPCRRRRASRRPRGAPSRTCFPGGRWRSGPRPSRRERRGSSQTPHEGAQRARSLARTMKESRSGPGFSPRPGARIRRTRADRKPRRGCLQGALATTKKTGERGTATSRGRRNRMPERTGSGHVRIERLVIDAEPRCDPGVAERPVVRAGGAVDRLHGTSRNAPRAGRP